MDGLLYSAGSLDGAQTVKKAIMVLCNLQPAVREKMCSLSNEEAGCFLPMFRIEQEPCVYYPGHNQQQSRRESGSTS